MKKKQTKKYKYALLGKRFCNWFEQEFNEVVKEWYGDIPDEILDHLEMSEKDIYIEFIKPFMELDNKSLKAILNVLANRLKDKLTPQPSPICLSLKIDISPKINALCWLLVHIADLKYFEFNDFVKSKYKKPYNQCLVCGKPDSYLKDGKVINFTHKYKYCHENGCPDNEANPQEHEEGCHYKMWAFQKKSLNQKLTRCIGRILNYIKSKRECLSNQDYEKAEKYTLKIKETKKEFFKIFETFYLEQYKKDCKLFYTIRAEQNDEIFDIREF